MYASDLRHSNPTLQDKLQDLYSLSRGKAINLDFRPAYLNLLEAFGNPHRALPPAIHVAGTNGKGSVVAAMKAIFEAAGYRVHTYTSPHLIRFNERIVLQGAPIDDDALESLIDEALARNDGADITFFEITTAMAFAAFSRVPADILLLETGLGGRMDCTNIVPTPRAAVITSIGYDHREFLGDTLPAIAREKAGIIKAGAPCILAPQDDFFQKENAEAVFEEAARNAGVPLYRHGREWTMADGQNGFTLRFQNREIALPLPALAGRHQIDNAATACMACLNAGKDFFITSEHLSTGLKNIRWPGRLQNLTSRSTPPGWEIWLDGAHNAPGAAMLAAHMQDWRKQDGKDTHILLGMMKHKDPLEFIAPLAPLAGSIQTIDIAEEPKAWTAQALAERIAKSFPAVHIRATGSVTSAIGNLATAHAKPGRVLITGSLYLAGQVLRDLGP